MSVAWIRAACRILALIPMKMGVCQTSGLTTDADWLIQQQLQLILFHFKTLIRLCLDIRSSAQLKCVGKYFSQNLKWKQRELLPIHCFIFIWRQDKKSCCTNISGCIHFVRFLFVLFILPSVESEGWQDSASSSVCRAVGGILWIYCSSPIENNECQAFCLLHAKATWMQPMLFQCIYGIEMIEEL